MFFYVFQGKKIKLVDKMKQSTHLYVSLHAKHKKIPILSSHFITWCSFWVKSRMPAGPTPIKYHITPCCREDQRLSTKGIKSFWNTATYQKLEGGSITRDATVRDLHNKYTVEPASLAQVDQSEVWVDAWLINISVSWQTGVSWDKSNGKCHFRGKTSDKWFLLSATILIVFQWFSA